MMPGYWPWQISITICFLLGSCLHLPNVLAGYTKKAIHVLVYPGSRGASQERISDGACLHVTASTVKCMVCTGVLHEGKKYTNRCIELTL